MKAEFQFDTDAFREELRAAQIDQMTKARGLLDRAGFETVAMLRRLIGVMRPPAHAGGGMRQARLGGWADVTGNLAASYGHDVNHGADSVELELRNTMEYARHLDQRDGYFVLSGVTEAGGPLEQAIERTLPAIDPEWRLER
jgi:hypothetical protein